MATGSQPSSDTTSIGTTKTLPPVRVWILKRKGTDYSLCYDETRGFTLVAVDDQRARELAWRTTGKGLWLSSVMTSCESVAEIVPEINDLYDPTERILLEDRLHG